jgi:hypothetical protein
MKKNLFVALFVVIAILGTFPLIANPAYAQEPCEFQPSGWGATVKWPDQSITAPGNIVVGYTTADHFKVSPRDDGLCHYNGHTRVVMAYGTDPITGEWLYQTWNPGWMPDYHVLCYY